MKKSFHILLWCLAVLISSNPLFSQTTTSGQDSLPILQAPRPRADSMISVGYGQFRKNEVTSATTSIFAENFNLGLIADPALLIQGKVPGIQIYNRGGDPNNPSLMRIRGLSGYSNRAPLVVIDGLPGASLQNLDPNDVASVTVLKDGSAQAIYGIRASNGVLLIETKDGRNTEKPLTISYNGQAALSSAYPQIPVMSAAEFRAAGGTDFGASTNWLEEIQRDGFSNMHSLALSGSSGTSSYRISGNYRNTEGVLRKSGFEQLNVRAHLNSRFFNDKLALQLSASYTDRSSQLGFQQAFRYAVSANPTAPIYAEDAPFAYNGEEFGGFFELEGLFDHFNPRALVDLNERDGLLQELTTSALLKYDIRSDISVNFRYAYQDQFSNERAYYSPQSLFRGRLFPSTEINGTANLHDYSNAFSLYEAFVHYKKAAGPTKWGLTLGTSYQDGDYLESFLGLDGFSNEALLGTKRIEDFQGWETQATRTDTINSGWSDDLSAIFGRMHLNLADKFILNASLRYEGSSKLGENQRWGLFPAVGMALNLHNLKDMPAFDLLKVRMGYGITGNLPERGGLSRETITLFEQEDGTFQPFITRMANPDLRWEEKSELNVGLDFKIGRLQGYVDWYTRKIKDWISSNVFEFEDQYNNINALTSTGVELGLELELFNNQTAAYSSGILLSTYRSEYGDLVTDQISVTGVGGPVQNPAMPAREGEVLGNIYAPVFLTTDPSGFPFFEDVNRDGMFVTEVYQIFEPESDLAVVGNGLPDVELGWSHHFQYKGWHLQALFRGAFGHSLVNRQRLFFEPRLSYFSNNTTYNLVNTELAIEELQFSRFSSLYVEKAGFLKLDFLSLSRSFSLGATTLNLSITGQNLFVLTNYTGADPEPELEDPGQAYFGLEFPFNSEVNPLAPGIDRRNHYLPARTVVLGVGLAF
jgi:TonB-linked SusC/RagA family outer membrane protein